MYKCARVSMPSFSASSFHGTWHLLRIPHSLLTVSLSRDWLTAQRYIIYSLNIACYFGMLAIKKA